MATRRREGNFRETLATWGPLFGSGTVWYHYGFEKGIAAFFVLFVLLAFLRRDSSAGTGTGTMRRRLIGFMAHHFVNVLALLFFVAPAYVIGLEAFHGYLYSPLAHAFVIEGGGDASSLDALATVLLLGAAYLVAFPRGRDWLKRCIGTTFESAQRIRAHKEAGVGGSAKFSGLFTDWKYLWKRGTVLLGGSTYRPKDWIGIQDDRHLLTIASNAAGKGRSLIIPNLLVWPGSAIVIDPKGTNAAVTAARRGHGGGRVPRSRSMGHDVRIFNPYKVNEGRPGMPNGVRFNPLDILDPDSPTFFEDTQILVEASVIRDKNSQAYFDDNGSAYIHVGIAHQKTIDPDGASLVSVYDMLTQPGGPPLEEMLANDRAGPMCQSFASQMLAIKGTNTHASVLSTAVTHLNWLASPAMREMLSTSDFDIFSMKDKPTTIYLVVPPEFLRNQVRFLRTFLNVVLTVATKGGRGKQPILFLMDEFHSLGRMETLATAAGNIRSYGVRLWPFVQNLSQLEELYGKNWQTFWANAGQVQMFSSNDQATDQHASQRLGRGPVFDRDPEGGNVMIGAEWLRDAQELGREVSREGGRQLVFREGAYPMLLERLLYDKAFPSNQFNLDPDHDPKARRSNAKRGKR